MAKTVLRGKLLKNKGIRWSQQGESNPRPTDYESVALPLSYTGSLSVLTSEHIENNRISINCQDYVFIYRTLRRRDQLYR